MRLKEYRAKRRALAAFDTAGLDDIDKHPGERLAVDLLTLSFRGFSLQVLHAASPFCT